MLDRPIAPTGHAPVRFGCATCGSVAPMVRLPMSELAPGELLSSDAWLATAGMLERAAASLTARSHDLRSFSRAQARETARRLAEAAAEIRANLALEEDFACRTR